MEKYKFFCENCNYGANKKQGYSRHLSSKKHIEICKESYKYSCNKCNKKYTSYSGFWSHKQLCKEEVKKEETQINVLKNEIMEMKELIIQLAKNMPATMIQNNDNSINSTNINVFLNEKCANAINIMDFVKTIVFDITNYENLLEKGYIKNKSDLIIDNLRKFSLYERPIHYLDKQEEQTIHIRDEDKWKTETNENKPILKSAFEYIENKEFDDFFKISRKITNGDVNNLPNFEPIKTKLISGGEEIIKNNILSNILNSVIL
jgi:hypothetical protein